MPQRRAIQCAACGTFRLKAVGEINRAARRGAPIYCNRECAGMARRKEALPDGERRRLKAEYDSKRRAEKADEIKAAKRAHHLATYDPAKAREVRKKRAPAHAEYCRRPEYRKWKKAYDRQHRCRKHYGPFWEAASLLFAVQEEVHSRATDYEIRCQNGTINKALNRRRDDERATANANR